ncbi:MAG: hypothetical protein FWE30_04280, partial [Bacteroidales bacterium]|nr:hypothetical protein [Bacteroidales bacterium]
VFLEGLMVVNRALKLNIFGLQKTTHLIYTFSALFADDLQYRDKVVRDSILKTDTIRVPYLVEVVKEVKKPLSGWQNFQLWWGRLALALCLLTTIFFVRKCKSA